MLSMNIQLLYMYRKISLSQKGFLKQDLIRYALNEHTVTCIERSLQAEKDFLKRDPIRFSFSRWLPKSVAKDSPFPSWSQ